WVGAFVSLMVFVSHGQESTASGYRVRADATGEMRCYGPSPDQSGQRVFVDNIYCVDSYQAARNSSGVFMCYATDAVGTAFGPALNEPFCSAGYRAATTSTGSTLCFNVDS